MRYIAVVGAVGVAAWVGHASALADNRGDAEQLFRDAQALLKAGRLAEACKTFEDSQRLDPNLATLMNVADCREKNGQLATAWSSYLEVASKARGDQRYGAMANIADQRAKALESRLSRLVINVSQDHAVDGLIVTRNGDAIDASLWSRPVAIDGGHYVIAATAPGRKPWSLEVDIANDRERRSVDIPALDKVEQQTQAAPEAVAGEPAVATASAPTRLGTQRKIALAIGAVAVGSFGGAIAFELAGRDAYADYKRTPEGSEREALYSRANDKHALGQAFAVGGLVATGAAAYLWWRGGQRSQSTVAAGPLITPSASGLTVVGHF